MIMVNAELFYRFGSICGIGIANETAASILQQNLFIIFHDNQRGCCFCIIASMAAKLLVWGYSAISG